MKLKYLIAMAGCLLCLAFARPASADHYWVTKVSSGGEYITLNNGAIVEVYVFDRLEASLWLPATSVECVTSSTDYGYPMALINDENHEVAHIKQIN